MGISPVLAVIPARAASKGLPGKNIASFAGLPLIVHSIRMAKLSPEIDQCVVSTDSPEIQSIAMAHGCDVPFLRPAELSQDDTPIWPVLQHALGTMEDLKKKKFASVLLLQPTNPSRLPEDVTRAVEILESDAQAVGVVSVSLPVFNPRWVCVEEKDGYLSKAFSLNTFNRRQDVPAVYRINGLLYLWRRDHIARPPADPWNAPHKMLILPEQRVVDIDDAHDLAVAEALLRAGLLDFPWLAKSARKPEN